MPKTPIGQGRDIKEVRAIELVRKMQGGAQAHMVRTDDGCYVCKWKENPQHRRVLINEVMGAHLLKLMEINTPDWAIVRVDAEFIDSNPSVGISLEKSTIKISVGLHFGSKVSLKQQHTLYDRLHYSLLDRLVNLDDFIKVFVFDLWTDNNDGRQAVFFRQRDNSSKTKGFLAQMIDSGFCFGFDGNHWRMRDRVRHKHYPQLECVYLRRSAGPVIESAIAAAQSVSKGDLSGVLDLLPKEWVDQDCAAILRVFDELVRRAGRLPDLVAQAIDVLRETQSPRRWDLTGITHTSVPQPVH